VVPTSDVPLALSASLGEGMNGLGGETEKKIILELGAEVV